MLSFLPNRNKIIILFLQQLLLFKCTEVHYINLDIIIFIFRNRTKRDKANIFILYTLYRKFKVQNNTYKGKSTELCVAKWLTSKSRISCVS